MNLLLLSSGATAATIIAILVLVLLSIFALSIRIVRQSTAVVVERLGKYSKILETGVHFILPFFDKTSTPISLKEKVADFQPQPVITKDNVTMQIDSVVYYSITDPKLYTYGIEHPLNAIENLTATTLRNIVGELELDETLTSRDIINSKMRAILDEATDPWGIKVTRVELKNILPPKDIRDAMEKQMRAERERREAILQAQGEKESAILVAEGEKQSNILKAEGEKESAILRAEARKAQILAESEGTAQAIKNIMAAEPNAAYLTLQGYEALKTVADGNATKLIIPSDIQNVATLFSTVSETLKAGKEETKKKDK